ncbi:predicted protein [Sclerotinia sclerotiorum 1980 UF-70]|uniref:Uncharacterized protein n=1 Tax=Sclerotinia sclerotiorum (strain ATCC 18683 / 1980 / Ss-1) TaxID=665079 RepID=A7ELP0_SCLS1|nr:predicted protein [Sclerotinia sclerotiorum 1980 UF-70]EDO03756.1 predicted protein [Sclerotinia sclerotiorum 1980 UF-70]
MGGQAATIRSFDLIAAASSMSRQVSSADFARSGYSGAASFMPVYQVCRKGAVRRRLLLGTGVEAAA